MKYIVIIVFIFLPQLLSAQIQIDSLELVRYELLEGNVAGVRFLSDSLILEIGDNYFVREIELKGEYIVTPGETDKKLTNKVGNFRAISQLGESVYIAGDKGVIIKYISISDYEQVNSFTNQDILNIENCNNIIVYVTSDNTLFITKDFTETDSIRFNQKINDIFCYKQTIYLACDDGTAYASSNNGKDWSKMILDNTGKNLLSIDITSEEILYFTGETVLSTDLDLNVISRSKINFKEENIWFIDDLSFINDSLAAMFLVAPGYQTYIVNFYPNQDTILPSSFSLLVASANIIYSSEYNLGCIVSYDSYYTLFNENNFEQLNKSNVIPLKTPPLLEIEDILSINSVGILCEVSNCLNEYNKNGDIVSENYIFDESKYNNVKARYSSLGMNDNTIVYILDSLEHNKKIPGASKLMISKNRGKNWTIVDNSSRDFSSPRYINGIISFTENDSIYKISTDQGDSWCNIYWPKIDGSTTRMIFPLDSTSFVCIPWFRENPKKTEYFKWTKNTNQWEHLAWFDNAPSDDFKNPFLSHKYLFLNRSTVLFYCDDNKKLYLSRDGFESFSIINAIDSLESEILIGKQISSSSYFFVDQKSLYITEDNFHTFEIIPHRLDEHNITWNLFNGTLDGKSVYKMNAMKNRKFTYANFDQLLSVIYSGATEYTELSVFPNPATDYIELVRNDIDFNLGMIFDYTGKVRKIISDFNRSTKLPDFESGIYFLILIDKKGNPYQTKFVVSK